MNEEKKLLKSQSELLQIRLQELERVRFVFNELSGRIKDELGINEKEFQHWQFSQDLTKIVNNKPPDPPDRKKKPDLKIPQGDKKNVSKK